MRVHLPALAAIVLVFGALGACGPAGAPAAPTTPAAMTISDAWAPATPGGAKVGAGYFTVTNPGSADDRLVAVSSPRAARVEIHDMAMQGDMMTMRPMNAGMAVPAGKSAALKPGAGHLMFIDISAPFVAGETIPVTLTFEKAGAVQTALPVRALGAPQ